MANVIWMGIGGFVGTIGRYLLAEFVHSVSTRHFPWGTLAVNLLGCLLMGLLSQWGESRNVFSQEARGFVFVGVLGGFTTFSAFGMDTFNLWRDRGIPLALVNVASQVIFCLVVLWLGRILGQRIWG